MKTGYFCEEPTDDRSLICWVILLHYTWNGVYSQFGTNKGAEVISNQKFSSGGANNHFLEVSLQKSN